LGTVRAVRVAICSTTDRNSEHRQLGRQLLAAGFAPQFLGPHAVTKGPAEERPSTLILICDAQGNGSSAAVAGLVPGLRAAGFTAPILFIGRSTTAEDAAAVLDSGADDYLRLPYEPVEVVARVRVLLRRSGGLTWLGRTYDGAVLDRHRHVLSYRDAEVGLTPREVAVLECLAERAGRPVAREELAAYVWGAKGNGRPPTNIVDVYVAYLRRKLETLGQASLIRSVRGVGYELAVSCEACPSQRCET
jgi:DNA-binding response OmpR family regulator